MVGFSTCQSGPKGTKMANLSVFDHLGPLWANLDSFGQFQTEINFMPQMDKVGFGAKKSIVFKWFKRVQISPKEFQMVKNA